MHVTPIDHAQGRSLYEQVADRVQTLIAEGTLQPGDRLPSVRKLHEQLSVSISTVLEAYRLLEDRGLIQARPQSGYYVRRTALIEPATPDEPATSSRQVHPGDNSLAYQVMQAMRDPNVVQLGAAVPSTDLLPLPTLNRLIGHVLRYKSEEAHADSLPPGSEALRHEVARRLLDTGCSVTPDQIVITNGAFEAVYLSLRAVTSQVTRWRLSPRRTTTFWKPLSFCISRPWSCRPIPMTVYRWRIWNRRCKRSKLPPVCWCRILVIPWAVAWAMQKRNSSSGCWRATMCL